MASQMRMFEQPVMSVREFVRQKLSGLEWRQRARQARRDRRAAARRGRVHGPLFAGGGARSMNRKRCGVRS